MSLYNIAKQTLSTQTSINNCSCYPTSAYVIMRVCNALRPCLRTRAMHSWRRLIQLGPDFTMPCCGRIREHRLANDTATKPVRALSSICFWRILLQSPTSPLFLLSMSLTNDARQAQAGRTHSVREDAGRQHAPGNAASSSDSAR